MGLEPDPSGPEPTEPASNLQLNGDIAQSRGDLLYWLAGGLLCGQCHFICPGTTRSQLPSHPETSGAHGHGRLPLPWPRTGRGRRDQVHCGLGTAGGCRDQVHCGPWNRRGGPRGQVNTKGYLCSGRRPHCHPAFYLHDKEFEQTTESRQHTHRSHEDATGPWTFMSVGELGRAEPALPPPSTGMPGRPPGKSKPARAALSPGSLTVQRGASAGLCWP